jgi:hypothetical protein
MMEQSLTSKFWAELVQQERAAAGDNRNVVAEGETMPVG